MDADQKADLEFLKAAKTVIDWLEDRFITESCTTNGPIVGCPGCEAVALVKQLEAFCDEAKDGHVYRAHVE